jgi:hypothetical protein
MPRRGRRLLT